MSIHKFRRKKILEGYGRYWDFEENALLTAEKCCALDHEAKFRNLEQNDKEKSNRIAKLDDDIKEIKQSSANTNISPKINFDNASNFDVCQESNSPILYR
ncbi:752_t:CDS:2 [Diversispora eburnea]|uniref:752_t:CDS:1 n=1 Tax=Diversispora eburnea TaxID=1213867 RepID=A0A9N8V1P0_9GLOM|nr:752_t:CDS:2 [Diversispora eburnea]